MRGLTSVVSDQRPGLVSERSNDGDLFDPRLERKQTVVLEQDHGFIREFARVRAMFGAVEFLLIDLGEGNHVRRVEHAELDARGEQADERRVQCAFRQVSLLHSVDIGLFDGLSKS